MKKTPRPDKFAVEKYRLNHSVKETATYFNLTLTTMEKILNEYEIYGKNYLEKLNAPFELIAEQKEIITGNLLGDGWLNYLKSNNSNSNFGIEQKLANYYYVTDLHNIYKPFSKKYTQGKREKILKINGKPSRSIWNGEYLYWCKFETMKHPIFTRLREKWYVDPFVAKSPKIIPKDIKITWKTIAYWACDDGSNDYKKRGFIFYTNGFKISEVEFLLEIFANQFGINQVYVSKYKIEKETKNKIIEMHNKKISIRKLAKIFNLGEGRILRVLHEDKIFNL